MENLFIAIRAMVSDSRMIAINTDVPQYKVQQVKDKLFLVAENQNKAVCDWWLRLYHGEYSKKDLRALSLAMEGKYYWLNDMEEVWCAEIDDDPSEREYM